MKPISNWHNAVAHIDADSFYASCERVRYPGLRSVPVCVLSNQNAFVVAKTYDAKAKGVTTGMSVWDARKLVPNAAFLPPDFRFYGQLSDKMFSILRRYSPEIEVYSIDEGFMDLNGLRSYWRMSFRQMADDIRKAIRTEVGITVSIGISTTKTLAKIASESNKPDGTTVVPGKRILRFLETVPVSDIPGIGRNRTALLAKCCIHTALDFVSTDEKRINKILGRLGAALWHELNGQPVFSLETETPLPKSVARTSSTGDATSDRARVAAFLSYHTHRLVSDLVAKNLLTQRICVFLTNDSFEQVGTETPLPFPTNSLKRIGDAVNKAFGVLYRPGTIYRGSGVIATHIQREESATLDLFGEMQKDLRQKDLMLTVNEVNRQFGNHALSSASALILGKRKPGVPRFQYPMIEAH